MCAGIARRYGFDPALVRLAFVIATAAGGFGVALYALAWLVVPAGDAPGRRRLPTGRGAVEVALGTGLLLLSALLTFRALGIWFSDAIVWPLVLVASGGALIWRGSIAPARRARAGRHGRARRRRQPRPGRGRSTGRRRGRRGMVAGRTAAAISRTGIGIALVIAAGFAFLQATGALDAARDVLLAVIAVVVVLGVIFAPWVLRLIRSLTEERSARIRSQERAEVAAHLHDSVLQTLALVQRSTTRSRWPRSPAARSASCAPGSRAARRPGQAARLAAGAGGRRGRDRGATTASRWRSSWSATASSTRPSRRWWPPPARR